MYEDTKQTSITEMEDFESDTEEEQTLEGLKEQLKPSPFPNYTNTDRQRKDFFVPLPNLLSNFPKSSYTKLIVGPISDTYYDMTTPGMAIILNHYKYHQKGLVEIPGKNRKYFDINHLRKVLTKLNFKPILFNNPSIADIEGILDNVSGLPKNSTSCIMFIVMTHGTKGFLKAADYEYKVEMLWAKFTDCLKLVGIPKLFFIQALEDDIEPISEVVTDSVKMKIARKYKIPSTADFVHMYSTYKDHPSKYIKSGTWFIEALCNVLEKGAANWDLLQLLTFVNDEVAFQLGSDSPNNENYQKKQMPQIVTTLTKLLKFNIKQQNLSND